MGVASNESYEIDCSFGGRLTGERPKAAFLRACETIGARR
jgi:hypothetical protein